MTLPDLHQELQTVRSRIKELNEELSSIKKTEDELVQQIVAKMSEIGVDSMKIGTHSYYIKTEKQPVVNDWAALYEYIKQNDAFYLLHRRTSAPAFREAFDLLGDEGVPGTEVFLKISLQTRAV